MQPVGKQAATRLGGQTFVNDGRGDQLTRRLELAHEGISVEIVDPRTLVPLDAEAIRNSVQKTGRLVIADEAGPTAGFSAEVAAVATEDAATFACLKRVCALQVPIPYSPVLENHVFPDRKRTIDGIREVLRGRRSAEAA
jgi:pyruvate/2-oxoglutarate/acetoin dehydrogenase E1 component